MQLLCVLETQNGAAKITFKKVVQVEVHLYTFILLCISLKKDLFHLAPQKWWKIWQSTLGLFMHIVFEHVNNLYFCSTVCNL